MHFIALHVLWIFWFKLSNYKLNSRYVIKICMMIYGLYLTLVSKRTLKLSNTGQSFELGWVTINFIFMLYKEGRRKLINAWLKTESQNFLDPQFNLGFKNTNLCLISNWHLTQTPGLILETYPKQRFFFFLRFFLFILD